MSKEEFYAALTGDIDPQKYAGEKWFATEEYARPQDISDRNTRYEVGREEDYYPIPPRRKR